MSQCQNPCSGPSALYQDLSKCHDWPAKKGIISLANQVEGKFKMHLGQLAESAEGTDQGSQPCFTQVSCWSNVMSATQASLLGQKKNVRDSTSVKNIRLT